MTNPHYLMDQVALEAELGKPACRVGFPLPDPLSILASLCYNGATGAVQFRRLAERKVEST
jgi:hypothetical protein